MTKTIQLVRSTHKAQVKAEKQAAFDRRYRARQLLFGKAGGKITALPPAEHRFVTSVWRECYNAYLIEYHTGKARNWYSPAAKRYRRMTRALGEPMHIRSHWKRWFASQKARWQRFDVPQMMKEQIHAAS